MENVRKQHGKIASRRNFIAWPKGHTFENVLFSGHNMDFGFRCRIDLIRAIHFLRHMFVFFWRFVYDQKAIRKIFANSWS